MKKFRKALAAFLCCGLLCTSATTVMSAASEVRTASSDIYDTTNETESKAAQTTSAEETAPVETTTEKPFNVFDIYNAYQGYIDSQAEPPIYRKSKGIDVSQWQGAVDWKKIGESDIEFAIIRAGYGKFASQKDPRFDENMRNAQAEGINCGTYWYSYALTVEDAYKEAEVCYEIIKNYDFNFPIYYDVEDPSQTGLSATQISAIIEAFCTTLQSKGCYVGIYSYANFLTTHVLTSVLEKYDVWVAHFGVSAPAFADYGIWQYTSSGNISGINGSVDLNYSYINYPYIISPETYTEPPAENPSIPSPPGSPESNVVAQGIDVSEWQGNINWKAVKSAGIDYAIIRAGYGKYDFQKDAKFDENMKKAQEVGVDRGVYWYSYASTTEDAVKEAEVCYNIIKDYKLEYPVYFNIEDNSVKNLSVSELTAIVEAFCSYMEDKGYYVGIASYSSFLNTKLDPSVFKKYDVWVAHYGVSAPQYYGNFGMWQYTEKASVDGVQTLVCRSYCYYDYPEIIKKNHLCGY